MSIAGVTPTIFAWEHRHILWLVLEANKETRDAAWLRINAGKRDVACYQREKLITAMFNRANSVPLNEYNDSYRLDWMCVPGTPLKRNPYRKVDGLTVSTALAVCGQMAQKLIARRAFRLVSWRQRRASQKKTAPSCTPCETPTTRFTTSSRARRTSPWRTSCSTHTRSG
jgi:hypothetical protein